MNAEVKKKWVEALRNDGYKQCQGSLRVDDHYCCLGVFCDIHNVEWEEGKNGQYRAEKRTDLPPDRLLLEAELSQDTCLKLMVFNDRKHWAFDKIADWIEDNL